MKKVLFAFLCFLTLSMPAFAKELVENAKSAILIEASTGEVLYEYNADEALAPASMTKIMTLLLTMEAVEKGTIKLGDMVRVSENAASMGGSQVFLEPNSEYTLDEMLKAVCIASGNDAAVVLAETIGGSVDNFVDMMNKRAKELGLTATNFVNPYGLDADGHLSSARDMAKMARELVKHELILKYSSIYEEYLKKVDGSSIWMVNTNKLVRFYSGVDGLKTGYTGKAGYCLTATGKWKNMRLISVVMGEPDHNMRTNDTVSLLNYGKSSYKINDILTKDKVLGKLEIELGTKKEGEVIIAEDIKDLVKVNDPEKKYTYKLNLNKIVAPVKVGDKVGTVDIYSDGKIVKKGDLTVKEDIPKCSLWTVMGRIMRTILTGSN